MFFNCVCVCDSFNYMENDPQSWPPDPCKTTLPPQYPITCQVYSHYIDWIPQGKCPCSFSDTKQSLSVKLNQLKSLYVTSFFKILDLVTDVIRNSSYHHNPWNIRSIIYFHTNYNNHCKLNRRSIWNILNESVINYAHNDIKYNLQLSIIRAKMIYDQCRIKPLWQQPNSHNKSLQSNCQINYFNKNYTHKYHIYSIMTLKRLVHNNTWTNKNEMNIPE